MLAAFTFMILLAPQDPLPPARPEPGRSSSFSSGSRGLASRFVDFHEAIDRRGFLAVVGTLQKGKYGKRKRLKNGRLGDATRSVSVSGTQYFELPVRAPIRLRAVLAGKPKSKSKVTIQFRVQLARLPSGEEQRQTMTANAVKIEPDMLALWILAAPLEGRGTELLHVIPFEAEAEAEADSDGEEKFIDAMADFVTVNQRLLALERALDAFDSAADDVARKKARARLTRLLEDKIELRRPELDSLMESRAGPWERRARTRLEPGPAAGAPS